VQYFVGDFDGRTFTSANSKATTLWADWGADFYAPQSWGEAPNGRRVWAAWLNNWTYAQNIPTSTWRGALTLPRELSLRTTPDGLRLVQRPIPELETLRGEHWNWRAETITPGANLLADISGETLEIIAEIPISADMAADRVGLRVRAGNREYTTIAYVTRAQKLYVDRAHSGKTGFSAAFANPHHADLPPIDGLIRLRIFVDRSSVEVFGNDGLVVFTDSIFPDTASLGLELFAEGGPAALNALDIYTLKAAAFYLPEPPAIRRLPWLSRNPSVRIARTSISAPAWPWGDGPSCSC
jgi:fructan beta-fructosidase